MKFDGMRVTVIFLELFSGCGHKMLSMWCAVKHAEFCMVQFAAFLASVQVAQGREAGKGCSYFTDQCFSEGLGSVGTARHLKGPLICKIMFSI